MRSLHAVRALVLALVALAAPANAETVVQLPPPGPTNSSFSEEFQGSLTWARSSSSISVVDGEYLRIGSDAGSSLVYGDWAEVALSIDLTAQDVVIESRMKLVSGGLNYRLPQELVYFEDGSHLGVTYLPSDPPRSYGWHFGEWTGITEPSVPGTGWWTSATANYWTVVRIVLTSTGGKLLMKPDDPGRGWFSDEFTLIDTTAWSHSSITGVRFVQPWDSVNLIDYIRISDSGLQCLPLPFDSALGGRLAFQSRDPHAGKDEMPESRLYVYSLQTGESLPLFEDDADLTHLKNPNIKPDGSMVAFMALPLDEVDALWVKLHVYVYDWARDVLIDFGPGQDPRFHPTDHKLIFKRRVGAFDELHVVDIDDPKHIAKPLDVQGTGHKSGPCYSPNGERVAFWMSFVNAQKCEEEDIWLYEGDEEGGTSWVLPLASDLNRREYFPVFVGMHQILYTRHEELLPCPNPSDLGSPEDVFIYNLVAGSIERAPFNRTGLDDSDPFYVNEEFVGFSQGNPIFRGPPCGGNWGYDIVFAKLDERVVYYLPGLHDDLEHDSWDELGASYTKYPHARALSLAGPSDTLSCATNADFSVDVEAWEDGWAWTPPGAVHVHVRSGDGTEWSVQQVTHVWGGRYFDTIRLPGVEGEYELYVSTSAANGDERQTLRSRSLCLSIRSPQDLLDETVDFVTDGLEKGTLEGAGPGASASGRADALRSMLEAAFGMNSVRAQIQKLEAIYERVDGLPQPPDFLTGEDRLELARIIDSILQGLESEL